MSAAPHYIVQTGARTTDDIPCVRVLRRAKGCRTYRTFLTLTVQPLWEREDEAVEIAEGLNELEKRRARDRRERARRARERNES